MSITAAPVEEREPDGSRPVHPRPAVESEITWLLHRAAQRMRTATGEQANRHGIDLRDHIVLSALHKSPGLTQNELGRALSLDKTTLMSQLDRLERAGLVERLADPRDRRARIPRITVSGEAVRSRVASAAGHVEAQSLQAFDEDQTALFRRMLMEIIGATDDPGSCL